MKLVHERIEYGLPWKVPDIYLFTGNPIVTKAGKLVMGRGAARTIRDAWPGVDERLAKAVTPMSNLAWLYLKETQLLGWFQVKSHWMKDAELNLIYKAGQELNEVANRNPGFNFRLNFPGIGNGRRSPKDVLPVIQESMPADNIFVHHLTYGLEELL